MMTILKMRYTIFTGVLYLHNGFVQSKQRFGEFLSSTLLNPKETEYKAEDINAELAHLFIRRPMTVSKVGA